MAVEAVLPFFRVMENCAMVKKRHEEESCTADLKPGRWIAYSESGMWYSIECGSYSFPTKRAVIEDIGGARLDARKTPRVYRIAAGRYEYYPKNCDDGTYGDGYMLVRLTAENISHFRKKISEYDAWIEDEMKREW